ncbi:Glycosyltransferase family 2 protein [Scedosporium apiospermum]|uniref:dolichyl-phosphate beta-glucosyltransferase n=1 Tax=Pseudallescheria apiosperma TaxID=563466 RepID=A0A084G196_PSEDA|nr:Glycosyltransferase family 2 protein [Scedosporium apiospermum]KEZ41108.1 Glycosyltransferase family 2 protein [Scedosporium apiospermum]
MLSLVYAFLGLPWFVHLSILLAAVPLALVTAYLALHYIAPKPRAPYPSEKTYQTTRPDGTTVSHQLPCWYDNWLAERKLSESEQPELGKFHIPDAGRIEDPTVLVSVVVPAYNEQDRISAALEEAVEYLDNTFGRPGDKTAAQKASTFSGVKKRLARGGGPLPPVSGYEIIVVSDGSRDRTVDVVLEFSRKHKLDDVLRVVTLEKNRGKGGAVTHGFRHVRGEYVLFADADGASKFSDLGRLIEGCEEVADGSHRGVAVGSRSHLVGSDAVVKRSALRNFLMRGFHFILMILTPPATSRIKDTQCGFKLFSRASLPHIVPYMHAEGWIFDVEMLMLAESAPATPVLGSDGSVIGTTAGIKVAEVPIAWHEVDGSKMSLARDSIAMALGLAVLRASWMMGVYRRRMT